MKDQLVEKLGAVLSGSVDSECKVVYILCEARKLLDKYPVHPAPFALKLYCHWALHIELSNPGTTAPFLEQCDNFVERSVYGREDLIKDTQFFRELLWLETFRREFGTFLAQYDLPTDICDVDSRWHEFLTHYAGVIEDGSLCCQSKGERLRHVRRVVFSIGRRWPDAFVPFDMVWTIELLDGRALDVEVHAAPLPNGKPMVISGITLHGSC